MKKVFLWCALALLIVLGLAPYWFGRQAEVLLHNFLAEAEATGQVSVRTRQYRRGWFQSTAETVVELPAGVAEVFQATAPQVGSVPGHPVVLTMTHQLLHGPVPWPALLQGQASFSAPMQLRMDTVIHLQDGTESLTTAAPMRIAATFGLAGGAWMDLLLPAGQAHVGPQEDAIIRWQAWQGHVTVTASGPRVTGTLGTASVTGEDRQGAITAHDVSFRVEAGVDDKQRYRGTLSVQGTSLALLRRADHQQDVTLQGWDVQNTATMTGENLDVTTMAQVHSIQTATGRYGPGTGTLAMRRLHATSVLTLGRTFWSLVQPDVTPHAAGLLSFGSAFAALPALAKQAPEVELSQLRVHTSAGEVRGQAKMALELGKTPGLMALLRPFNALAGQGEVAAPVALLQQILPPASQAHLQQLEQQGYVVRDGEHYVLTARVARGQLLLNSKPLALSLLGG